MKQFRVKAPGSGRMRKVMLAGCAMGAIASAAVAQVGIPSNDVPLKLKSDYFGYAASVTARAGYSSNINLARDGLEEDEYSVSSGFSLGAIFSKPAVTGVFLGDLDLSYLTEQDEFVVNQDIGVASTFTGVDNWLYLDVAGSTSRQLLGDNARFSGNINAGRGQRANVHQLSVSPYIHHETSDDSAVSLRYRFSKVFVDDSDADVNPFDGDLFNDSRTHEASATYETGNLFPRMRFRTSVYGSETVEEGSDIFDRFEYRQGSVFTEAQFALSRKLSLSGAVGYDEIETDGAAAIFFDDDDLSGVFWRAGIIAQPGRGSSVRLEYGERYGDDFVDASVYYELSRRFAFTAGASRTFQTRAEANNVFFRGVSRQVLEFADRLREGGELSPRGVIDAANRFAGGFADSRQTLGIGTSNSAYAALTGNYDRTQVNLSGFYSDTNFGFRDNTSYGLSVGANRQLSRRLTAYGDVTWRHTDTTVDQATCEATPQFFGLDPADPLFDPIADCLTVVNNNGVTNTLIGSIGASLRLYENVSAFAEYSRAERFSENALIEYSENSVIAGVKLDF